LVAPRKGVFIDQKTFHQTLDLNVFDQKSPHSEPFEKHWLSKPDELNDHRAYRLGQ